MPNDRTPIQVELLPDPPACPQCLRPGLLAINVPRAITTVGGLRPAGTFQTVLCAQCGLDDPHAAPLVLFFTVHGHVDDDNAGPFAELLWRWIAHLHVPHISEDTISQDIAAWRDGDFD